MSGSGMSRALGSEEEISLLQQTRGHSSRTWKPRPFAFQPYVVAEGVAGSMHQRPGALRVIVNKPLVVRLTKDIVETYQICNPTFTYSDTFNPKYHLTNPSAGVLNDGFDNINSDLILAVNFVLVNSDANRRYIVRDMLGQGTFGQVVKCWSPESNNFVAVKVIKNQPAYYHQALVEISILTMLNQKYDPEDKHHIVRILDHFVFQKHLCIAFEMLGVNLFELLRMNQYRGISLKLLRLFAKQILDALLVLREANVIHCDLKPENILLTTSVQSAEIKLIDFGSACMENRTVYSYIQSRFYRSPEVLLGHPYTTAIDMWSFGCIVAELFLGLPLFPGASEYDLIKRMVQILRDQPPDHILKSAKNTSKYFKLVGSSSQLGENQAQEGQRSAYHLLSESEYEAREMRKPVSGKRYFNYDTLEEIVVNYPYRKKMTEEEIARENQTRLAFIDFLRGLVQFDPVKRWTPRQAVQHPFVTDDEFTCPFTPPPEIPRTPVCQIVRVDHNPGAGHWFGAGLSPQVTNINKCNLYNSPQYQQAGFSYASSYGSVGSHGSYGDGVGLGGSFGSYGDMSNKYIGYYPLTPSGINIQNQGASAGTVLGASPDTRWRLSQVPPMHALGISPSNSMLRPMSLGASPSQFTPPSSQMQVPSGSPKGSPGRYGPPSPARAGSHVTGLGKAAAVGQYHKRRGFGISGSLHMQSQDPQHLQGAQKNIVASSDSTVTTGDGNRSSYAGSPHSNQPLSHLQPWRQRCASGIPASSNSPIQHKVPCSSVSTDVCSDGVENSTPLPDPGDWDPNYSDELLLEEDGSEIMSPRFASAGSMRFAQGLASSSTSGPNVSRSGRNNAFTQVSSSSNSNVYRSNGLIEGYSSLDGSQTSVHGMQPNYNRSMPKSLHHGPHSGQQNSPSRLGQNSSQFLHQQYSNYRQQSMLNPNMISPPNAFGQKYSQKYMNQRSAVGGSGSLPSFPPTSKDPKAEIVHFPVGGSGMVIGASSNETASQWQPGMGHLRGQTSLTHEMAWGIKTDATL
eukprot:TRINITY_DN9318_c0_g1_i1.p1 TRINITY_DN9318_c0_g1~~TRINITY_DN9318_c0_g1_i1.p1  ORF type:complete len:1022 (-),score=206.92 TRINITY_DN9318_c0_g1_i1:595-3660(-)